VSSTLRADGNRIPARLRATKITKVLRRGAVMEGNSREKSPTALAPGLSVLLLSRSTQLLAHFPLYPGANQPCQLLQCNGDLTTVSRTPRLAATCNGSFSGSRLARKEKPRLETKPETRTSSYDTPTTAPRRTIPETSKGNTRERGAQSQPKACVKTPVSSVLRASPSPQTARPGSRELPVDPDCDLRWGFPCCL